MKSILQLTALLMFALLAVAPPKAMGQQIFTETPFTTVSDSYFERTGVNFGFTIPGTRNFRGGDKARGIVGLLPNGQINPNGITFSQGGVHSAIPQFGYDPNSVSHIGFRNQGGRGGSFDLSLFLGKGRSTTLTNQTPSIVTHNGFPGRITNQISRPFVTSVIPVLGSSNQHYSYSPIDIALQRLAEQGRSVDSLLLESDSEPRRQAPVRKTTHTPNRPSSATQGALSVSEIKRQRIEKKRAGIEALLQKVDAAEKKGHFASARNYLSQAIRKTDGSERRRLELRHQQLKKR